MGFFFGEVEGVQKSGISMAKSGSREVEYFQENQSMGNPWSEKNVEKVPILFYQTGKNPTKCGKKYEVPHDQEIFID